MPDLLGGDAQDQLNRIDAQSAAGPGLQGQFVEDGGRGVGFAGFAEGGWLGGLLDCGFVGWVALVWIHDGSPCFGCG